MAHLLGHGLSLGRVFTRLCVHARISMCVHGPTRASVADGLAPLVQASSQALQVLVASRVSVVADTRGPTRVSIAMNVAGVHTRTCACPPRRSSPFSPGPGHQPGKVGESGIIGWDQH